MLITPRFTLLPLDCCCCRRYDADVLLRALYAADQMLRAYAASADDDTRAMMPPCRCALTRALAAKISVMLR